MVALPNGWHLSGNPRLQYGSHHNWDAGAVDRSKRVLGGGLRDPVEVDVRRFNQPRPCRLRSIPFDLVK